MFTKKQLSIIAAVIVTLFIVVPVVLFTINKKSSEKTIEAETPLVGVDRVDPVSGETITESTRTHESDTDFAIIGATQLLDIGFSMSQYQQLENAFETLQETYGEDIKMVSFYKDSAQTVRIDDAWVYKAKIQINEEFDHGVYIKYENLQSVTLEIYDTEYKEKQHAAKGFIRSTPHL